MMTMIIDDADNDDDKDKEFLKPDRNYKFPHPFIYFNSWNPCP